MANGRASLLSRITIDPHICGGRPCIRGMRYRVSELLGYLAAGNSVAEVVEQFPGLEPDDVRACLAYAQAATDGRPVYFGADREAA